MVALPNFHIAVTIVNFVGWKEIIRMCVGIAGKQEKPSWNVVFVVDLVGCQTFDLRVVKRAVGLILRKIRRRLACTMACPRRSNTSFRQNANIS